MKKRMISLLLTLCMVVAMFACLGSAASADGDTFTYTVKSGDTLWGLCSSKGLNYYTCKNAIKTLNGFTSDYQLSHISVGDTITLPISDAVASTLAASGSSTTTTTTTTSGSTTTTTTTTTNTLSNGDVVSYYLIAHTMSSGETVQGIYTNWGLSYKTYSDQILSVNSLKSYNKMYAGKTYLFPSPSVPSGSTAAYSVIAHKVVSGDSAYNLCSSYNTNYNKTLTVIKSVNGGSDLTSIKSGQIIYIPASGTVSTGSSGSSGTGTGTGTGTGSGTGSSSTTAYAINSVAAKNGSFVTNVSGSAVTSAKSGASVTIVTTPSVGYVVSSILVSKADDASTTVATNSSVFTMPAYAVNITVTFKLASTISSGTAHKITISATNGSATAVSNGDTVTTAKAGTFVTIVPTASKGYTFDSVKVTYNNYASNVPTSSNAFNMPDADVNVVVSFSAIPTYDITLLYTNNGHGSFYVKADGVKASKAMAGQTITIVNSPDAGYSVNSVNVTYTDGTAVSMIDAYSFIMPAQAVRVGVSYAASYAIGKSVSNGTITTKVDGVAAGAAVAGKVVTVVPTANTGYTVTGVTAKDAKGAAVTVTDMGDGTYTFTMPASKVTVTATNAKLATYALTFTPDTAKCTVKFMVNGSYVTQAAEGVTVKVVAGTTTVGSSIYKLSGVTSSDATITGPASDGSYSFVMPPKAVDVDAAFTEAAKPTITVNFGTNCSKVALKVDGKEVASATSSPLTCADIYEGKTVTIEATCIDGYTVNAITSSDVTISSADSFVVGSSNITVQIATRGLYRSITADAVSNGSFTLVDENGQTVTNTAASGTKIYVKPMADKNYELEKVSYSYLSGGTVVTKDITSALSFTMPGADVTMNVSFVAVSRTIASISRLDSLTAAGLDIKVEINGKYYAASDMPKAIPAGTVVKILPVITSSYIANYSVAEISILDKSNNSIKGKVSFDDSENTFVMPVDYDEIQIGVKFVENA